MHGRGWVSVGAAVVICTAAQAEVFIGFDQDEYTLQSQGERLEVQIVLDGEDTVEDRQKPGDRRWDGLPHGLFSLALAVRIEGARGRVAGVQDVVLPEPISDDGTGRPANILIQDGAVSIRAALKTTATDYYHDNLLATLYLTDLPSQDEPYTLSLHLLRSSPREQVFIDGSGDVLDERLRFGTAQVVIPEPVSAASWVALGAAVGLIRRRARAVPFIISSVSGGPSG